jgi:hypothetical protein
MTRLSHVSDDPIGLSSSAPMCRSGRILFGHDGRMTEPREPVLAVIRDLRSDWENGQPDAWENWTIPQYLDAMGAWLEVYEQAYINNGQPVPNDGWAVFAAALRAGAFYE